MRKVLLPLLLSLLFPAVPLHARMPLRSPVEVGVMGFKAKVDDGRVVVSWYRYKRDDFDSYALVKSAANALPVYPDDPVIFLSGNKDDKSFEDGKLSLGTWHYRLCIITRFGDRWVSPVVTVTVDENVMKRAAPTAADFESP